MKQMRGELKLFQEQVKQHKRDIAHLGEKREELKGAFFQTMRDRAADAYAQTMTGRNNVAPVGEA